jgi:hypothetical protein
MGALLQLHAGDELQVALAQRHEAPAQDVHGIMKARNEPGYVALSLQGMAGQQRPHELAQALQSQPFHRQLEVTRL